jgi:hypothetical protein
VQLQREQSARHSQKSLFIVALHSGQESSLTFENFCQDAVPVLREAISILDKSAGGGMGSEKVYIPPAPPPYFAFSDFYS